MVFKFNISTKEGKTYKLESEAPGLIQKEIGETISGIEISPDLAGYELKITGASDNAGFPAMQEVEGVSLKKVLLGYGKGMKNKPKGLKKRPVRHPEGLRMRRTQRGKVISPAISQINTQIIKEGHKKLKDIFPEQNKTEEVKAPEVKTHPNKEATGHKPTEGNPEKEPKASKKEQFELANPDKEPR